MKRLSSTARALAWSRRWRLLLVGGALGLVAALVALPTEPAEAQWWPGPRDLSVSVVSDGIEVKWYPMPSNIRGGWGWTLEHYLITRRPGLTVGEGDWCRAETGNNWSDYITVGTDYSGSGAGKRVSWKDTSGQKDEDGNAGPFRTGLGYCYRVHAVYEGYDENQGGWITARSHSSEKGVVIPALAGASNLSLSIEPVFGTTYDLVSWTAPWPTWQQTVVYVSHYELTLVKLNSDGTEARRYKDTNVAATETGYWLNSTLEDDWTTARLKTVFKGPWESKESSYSP